MDLATNHGPKSIASSANASTAASSAPSTKPPSVVGLSLSDSANHKTNLRYVDVGINLTDPVYRGLHHGKKAHEDDFEHVLQRAVTAGCKKLMITGSDLKESRRAIKLAEEHPGLCFATVGVHPCSSKQFRSYQGGAQRLLEDLEKTAIEGKQNGHAVAFGEIGLDYDRLFLSSREDQLEFFEKQLEVAVKVQLPLFLHSRAASEDFERLLGARLPQLPKGGVVHSFTGTIEEMQRLIGLGLHVGINGCSMKTDENMAVVKEVPLDKLQIETDGPWCEMRPSHASAQYTKDAPPLPKSVRKEKWDKSFMVKGRNEPCAIPRVAWAIAKVKGVEVEEVCEAAWNNSVQMFGLGEKIEEE